MPGVGHGRSGGRWKLAELNEMIRVNPIKKVRCEQKLK